jgi:hypothetical protein
MRNILIKNTTVPAFGTVTIFLYRGSSECVRYIYSGHSLTSRDASHQTELAGIQLISFNCSVKYSLRDTKDTGSWLQIMWLK